MPRYLTTRKRNIKKYKKSRTGRGKGRRSIRRCKTRKPKGFKKAKRHTVGKRRRMVGGEVFDFNVDAADLQVLLSSGIEKYRSPFAQKYIMYNGDSIIKYCNNNPIIDPRTKDPKTTEITNFYGFEKVELVAKGFALVTKTGTLFSRTNRKEQLNVFACYMKNDDTNPLCYAIVRCSNKSGCSDTSTPNPRLKPNSNMDSKILFLFVNQPTTIDRQNARLLQPVVNIDVTKLGQETVDGITYNVYEFTNNLTSDDDTYRILVPEPEKGGLNLNGFFNTVSKVIESDPATRANYKDPLLDVLGPPPIRMRRECVGPDSQGSDSSGGVSVAFEAFNGLG